MLHCAASLADRSFATSPAHPSLPATPTFITQPGWLRRQLVRLRGLAGGNQGVGRQQRRQNPGQPTVICFAERKGGELSA